MRKLNDQAGIEIEVERVNWQLTYGAFLCGAPEEMNPQIFDQILPSMLTRFYRGGPWLVRGSDQRRTRSQVFDREPHPLEEARYLPRELCISDLASHWTDDPDACGSHLVLAWFQDPVDPFAQLATILADLDWTSHARSFNL